MKKFLLPLLALVVGASLVSCDEQPRIYGAEPLEISSLRQWERVHRPVIYDFFEKEVYGRMPEKQVPIRYELLSEGEALGGKAVRREVAMHIEGMATPVPILMYIPAAAEGAVPAFLGMNFKGNHQINPDPEITISVNAPKGEELGSDPERGAATSRWPLELLMDNGYALVTIYRGDVDPDFDDGFQNGVHPLFYAEGQSSPAAEEWGTIGAWAWSLSRVMDYLCAERQDMDTAHVAVIGHSRLGKTALWCGALDERFAAVISNNSGYGGAASSRHGSGERVTDFLRVGSWDWYCENFKQFTGDLEDEKPYDQSFLLAMIAPRLLCVGSAETDRGADPQSEFLTALHASAAWELLGVPGLVCPDRMPEPGDHFTGGNIGYHLRGWGHALSREDWRAYIRYLNLKWKDM